MLGPDLLAGLPGWKMLRETSKSTRNRGQKMAGKSQMRCGRNPQAVANKRCDCGAVFWGSGVGASRLRVRGPTGVLWPGCRTAVFFTQKRLVLTPQSPSLVPGLREYPPPAHARIPGFLRWAGIIPATTPAPWPNPSAAPRRLLAGHGCQPEDTRRGSKPARRIRRP